MGSPARQRRTRPALQVSLFFLSTAPRAPSGASNVPQIRQSVNSGRRNATFSIDRRPHSWEGPLMNFPALDVALGLAFIFFVLAITCSGINEAMASALRWRAQDLERG